MPTVGERYLGTVVKTTNFGAFVSLTPGKDGLLHISQVRKLAGGKRIEAVEDVLKVGDKIQVELAEIDQRGKISLGLVDDSAPKADAGASDGAASSDGSADAATGSAAASTEEVTMSATTSTASGRSVSSTRA